MPSPYDEIIEQEAQAWRREIEERSVHQSLYTDRHHPSDPPSSPLIRIDTTEITPSKTRHERTFLDVEQPFSQKSCCDLSLVSGITAVNLSFGLTSECCSCTPDCNSYTRGTGRTWMVTTSDPPEVDHFLFKCFNDPITGIQQLDFSATSHAFGTDLTGRGVILEINDSDLYWVNADIGYLSYFPFPPNCGETAVAPFTTLAEFDNCDDTFVVTFPPEIGDSYSPATLFGAHVFTQTAECFHHPGLFYNATWTITFS